MGKKMVISYIACIFSYLIALILAILTGSVASYLHPLLIVLFADLVGTIIIYLISTILKNTNHIYNIYYQISLKILRYKKGDYLRFMERIPEELK